MRLAHLKPYGLECVQIDAGWFRTYGDWEGNQRFPHGMKWLAGKIRELGLRAGLWLVPYGIAEGIGCAISAQAWPATGAATSSRSISSSGRY